MNSLEIIITEFPYMGNDILKNYWDENIKAFPMKDNLRKGFIENPMDMFIYTAFYNEKLVGIAVVEKGKALWLLHVIEIYRSRGIGTTLLNSVRFNNMRIGSGSGYWWQGIPIDCGVEFFEKRGFKISWTSVDMICSLENLPKFSESCISLLNYEELNILTDTFAKSDLEGFACHYKHLFGRNKILAAHTDGKPVGGVILLLEEDIRFKFGIEGKVGGIGCLGVIKEYREQGIGASLVCAAHEMLKNEGYNYSYAGYTYLEAWYGKLGYKTLCKFAMGELI